MSKPLVEYHQSSIAMFLKCPRQYMFRYEMGMVMPPKAALTLGRAVDIGVTTNFKQKIETKTDVPIEAVLDSYSDSFEKESLNTIWEDEKPGDVKDLGVKMLKHYHEVAAPKIQPISVQEGFRIETEEYALGGTLDLTDENKIIRDTKTSKMSYQEDAVSDSLQATMYDFAYETKHGEKANGFAYDVITKTKVPKYQEIKGVVTLGQRERMFESISIMHKQIYRGEYQYAPEGAWWCSKGWCGYWDQCKGKK